MAKLTARFDVQDKISRKLRAIRGEIDAVERARARVNKPLTMTMRIRDNATKILRRFHMFVLKDIAKTHTVTVQVRDKATKALTAVSNFMKRRMPRTHALFVSATDRATPILRKISGFAQRNLARTQLMTILATDRAMPTMRRIGSFAKSTFSRGYNFSVRATDMASRVIGRVSSYAATAIPRVRTFTIRAINAASNVIGSVRRALFSLPAVFTVTLAAVGVGSLTKSTVGSAMNFEDYGVSMDHWLKGDKKASANLMEWMGQKADLTPYNSADIFPAMVGAVSLAGDNLDEVKRLTSISIDMAALTPGRTVEDAMQALKNVNMGEYSMMSGFGKDLNKEMFDKMGWQGFLKDVESTFEGGALKLSETGRGLLNMLTGYMTSQFRSMGDGILESMKPRLRAVTQWLLDNPKAWAKWKKTVEGFGTEASEWVFSKFENGFTHIKNNYLENDNFKNLDFEGKIKFISEDIGQWWSSKGKPALNGWWESSGKPWAEEVGLFVGKTIFDGIVLGIKEGGKALGNMWLNAFKDPSLGSLGGAGVATLLAGALSSVVLSPLIKGIEALAKAGGSAWEIGKKAKDLFGAGVGKRTVPKNPTRRPDYRMPWTNRGERPNLNTPNQKGGFRMPKGLDKLGNFAKRIPVLGTALGTLAIATSNKGDRAGTVGAVGGGLAGAATGAAIGSAIPGIGTAIGGVIGGIVGSLGGQAIGDWLSNNWSSIKVGATSTGAWISGKFNESVDWVRDVWGAFAGWFSDSVWTPISDGVSVVVGWISDKWGAFSNWFMDRVWNPIMYGADKTISFIVGLYDIGETIVRALWNSFSDWFDDKVWTPLKVIGEKTWESISTKVSNAWTGVKLAWGIAVDWFKDIVWSPMLKVAGLAWFGITGLVSTAWTGIQTVWSFAVAWFDEVIWSPLMNAAEVVGVWIGDKFSAGWDAVVAIWSLASGWFDETIWSPLSTAAEVLGTWIGDKFSEGWEVVEKIWGVASKYFVDHVWTPIETSAKTIKDSITKPFIEAWEIVSGIFSKLGKAWDTMRNWGGNAIDYVVRRGEERRGITPAYARGTNFHPGGPAIVGDGGGPELIRYPDGGFSLSPAIDTLMNLPRGTEVLSHRKTMNFFNAVPAYAGGIGFGGGAEKEVLSEGRVAAATSSGQRKGSIIGGIRDVIVQITGENHYHDDMDAEKVGKVAVKAVTEELKKQRFEGGEMAIDD